MKRKFVFYLSVSLVLFTLGIIIGLAEKAGMFDAFNTAVVKWASSTRSATLNSYFIAISKWTDTAHDIGYGLAVVVILALLKRWKEPLELFLSLLFAGISIEALKLSFKIPRPHFSWLVNAHSYSYPSGHSVGAVALYGMLLYIVIKSNLPKVVSYTIGTFLTFFIFSIFYDRWYVGVHWGMDVIGGGIIGLACLLLALAITQKMEKTKDGME